MASRPLDFSELKPALCPTVVKDSAGLKLLKDFFSRVFTFGLDTETNMVPTLFRRKIRTVQVGNRDEQYVVDLLALAGSTEALMEQGDKSTPAWAAELVDILRYALESKSHVKVGHNLQFDYEVLWWCLGLRPWNFYDTLLAEKVLYCGRVPFFQDGFWALDDLVERYCSLKIDKSLQKSFDLESELTQDQVYYAALDTRLPLAIMKGQEQSIKKAGLRRCVDLENNAIPAFGDMKVNGFYLDREDWLKNVETTKKVHEENIKGLDRYFVPVVGSKKAPNVDLEALRDQWMAEKDRVQRAEYRKLYQEAHRKIREWEKNAETYEGEAAINYGSGPQLLVAFRKMGFGVKKLPNTNDDTLKTLADNPAIQALRNYRTSKKALDTYGVSFLENIDLDTGRIHSNINQIGAATGRTSSSSPNLQNIPQGSEYRLCFKARPGYKLVTVDMSGAELCIMAELSGEPVWVNALNNRWDVHSVDAEMMYRERWTQGTEEGCQYVAAHKKCGCKCHGKLRKLSKAPSFKLAYGGEDLSNDLGISKQESGEIVRTFKSVLPVLTKYLDESGKKATQTFESRTFSGRRRLYTPPTWESAKEKAIERAKDDGKDPALVGSTQVSRAYYTMFGNIERQGKNTPIQGGNADIAKVTMGCGYDKNGQPFMWHRLWSEFQAELVMFVHDEAVVECPEENAEACKEWIQDCIKRAGAEFMTKVTMESEGKISDRWEK